MISEPTHPSSCATRKHDNKLEIYHYDNSIECEDIEADDSFTEGNNVEKKNKVVVEGAITCRRSEELPVDSGINQR